MALRELLQTDMKTAMKEREAGKLKLAVLRMAWAAIRNKEIDEKTTLNDDAVIAVLMKEVKQREDTIAEIKDANRPDLVEKNQQEIEILKNYLPKPLSDDELEAIVKDVIAAVGAKSMKDMGKVMGRVMAQTHGRASGQKINALVKGFLQQ
ncbi:MAG: GatB/YqeY domain-containing protein [Acidaminococcus sp.]|nr:GatB/YqeY domain-containing protein [Acidaminococcus sp.]MCI2115986.1 GatB/YqeY domain-containing protein [Acidaminococcus sp.]